MNDVTNDDAQNIVAGSHPDPFSVLGQHLVDGKVTVRAYHPDVDAIDVIDAKSGRKVVSMDAVDGTDGLFSGTASRRKKAFAYRLKFTKGAHIWEAEDPYRFGPVLGELDEHLIAEGAHLDLWKVLGAHVMTHNGVSGTHFAVWAPNAKRVSVVGDFNGWDGRRNPMRGRGNTGVWEIFMPGLGDGEAYKYELIGPQGELLPQKADPFGFGSEHPPKTASVVRDLKGHGWTDAKWMKSRAKRVDRSQPISIYEVHLGSWRRRYDDGGRPLSYKELARDLIGYVKYMGFTHIELLPITEFPFDGSWGYQPVGLFAPTIRFGPPHEFREFVEAAHAADIGVLLDWVPGHFPADEHGLARFDGTALYEHADPREGFHQDWNTLIPNFGRKEVKNYLVANALYWMEEHHLDGLRVDAVASMLYRDYSRDAGEWVPNKDGGRENLEAIEFLKEMNIAVYGADSSVMTVAEESTSFPAVSQPVHSGGLGFGYKWNMGWMNDTLRYMEKDPIYRQHDHHLMTFPIDWAFTENFILPISHDEVVHGKGSMIDKMPGSDWEKFANLRAYYAYMWCHPGKKLLFMGCEFAQPGEWKHDDELNWGAAEQPANKGVQRLIQDLNALYRSTPAMHAKDCEHDGFAWLHNDPSQSTIGFARYGDKGDAPVVVMCNFTPVERTDFRLGVPEEGFWEEVLNSDADIYGGGNRGNLGGQTSQDIAADGQAHSIRLTLPPLAVVVLRLKSKK